jgi:hypothetical protein
VRHLPLGGRESEAKTDAWFFVRGSGLPR